MLCRFPSVQSEHVYWAAEFIMQMSQPYKSLKWAEFGQKWNRDFPRSYPIVYSFTYLPLTSAWATRRLHYANESPFYWVYVPWTKFEWNLHAPTLDYLFHFYANYIIDYRLWEMMRECDDFCRYHRFLVLDSSFIPNQQASWLHYANDCIQRATTGPLSQQHLRAE